MKKLSIIVTIIFMGMMSANAQRSTQREQMTPEKRAERMTERMSQQLELSEIQKAKIQEIHLNGIKEREVVMNNMRENQTALREKIQEVLTVEQKEKWAQHNEEIRNNRKNMRNQSPKSGSEEPRKRMRIRPENQSS